MVYIRGIIFKPPEPNLVKRGAVRVKVILEIIGDPRGLMGISATEDYFYLDLLSMLEMMALKCLYNK